MRDLYWKKHQTMTGTSLKALVWEEKKNNFRSELSGDKRNTEKNNFTSDTVDTQLDIPESCEIIQKENTVKAQVRWTWLDEKWHVLSDDRNDSELHQHCCGPAIIIWKVKRAVCYQRLLTSTILLIYCKKKKKKVMHVF